MNITEMQHVMHKEFNTNYEFTKRGDVVYFKTASLANSFVEVLKEYAIAIDDITIKLTSAYGYLVYAHPNDLIELAEEIDLWEHHLDNYEPPEDSFDYDMEYYPESLTVDKVHNEGISVIEDKPYAAPWILGGLVPTDCDADYCGVAGHEKMSSAELVTYKYPYTVLPAHPMCKSDPKPFGIELGKGYDHAVDAMRIAGLGMSGLGADFLGGARGGGKIAKVSIMAEAYGVAMESAGKAIGDAMMESMHDKGEDIIGSLSGIGDVAIHTSDIIPKGEAIMIAGDGIHVHHDDYMKLAGRVAEDLHKKAMGVAPKPSGKLKKSLTPDIRPESHKIDFTIKRGIDEYPGLKKIFDEHKSKPTSIFITTNPGSPVSSMGAMSTDVAKEAGIDLAKSIDKSIARSLIGGMESKKYGEWK